MSASAESVAAVVVTYRSEAWIAACLDSIRQQPEVSTIWVVDNASDDATVELVRDRYPDVRLICNDDNPGFAVANNQALRQIGEPYVLLLNPDAALEAGALAAMLVRMRGDPELAVVGPRIMRNGRIEDSLGLAATPMQSMRFLFSGMRDHESGGFSGVAVPGYPWNDGAEGDHVRGSCMLVRRTAIDDVGPLDENFFLYFEETEWCLRMRDRGWRIGIVPLAVARHAGKASIRTQTQLPSLEYMRSAILFWHKRFDSSACVMLRSTLWLMAAFKRLLLTLSGRGIERRAWLRKVMLLAADPYAMPIEYAGARRPSGWSSKLRCKASN